MAVTFLTNEDEKRILEDVEAGKLLYTQQTLTDGQKAQARANIGAAPGGYGFGQQYAAPIPGNDADYAVITGVYAASSGTANLPEDAKNPVLLFVQAKDGDSVVQMLYNSNVPAGDDVDIAIREHNVKESSWGGWKWITQKKKVYELIATVTVAPGADGSLPQHVTFSADSNGNAFQLTDFMVKAYAGFVDGNASTLCMAVNGKTTISGSAIPSISTALRGFNVFFRKENDNFVRTEHTVSVGNANVFNPANKIAASNLIPTMSEYVFLPVSEIDLFTQAGTTKAWVEGSTFELWGVRA